MLVASRALQGIGGGAIMVTATALIGEVIPLRDRGRYQGALGAVFGVTTVVGPLLGGFFTDHLSWRWAFWINVPVAVVVFLVAIVAIPALGRTTRPVIDYAGIVFVGLGASGLTLATSWGGAEYAWSSPVIIGLFVASAAALAVFVWVESRATEPILPIRLFRSPVFTVCCVLSFIVGFAMLGALTFLPTFMQFVDGVSATMSGLRTLPMVAGLLLTSMGSGVIVSRTGRYKIFPVVGTAVMVVGFVLLSRMDATTPMLVQSLYLFILGTGIGMCMQVLILIVQNTSSFADLGVATSGVTFFRTIGSSFGAAIFGSLFANFLQDRIGPALAQRGATGRGAVPAGVAPLAARRRRADRQRVCGLAGHGLPLRGPGGPRRVHRRAVAQRGSAARDGRRQRRRSRRRLRHAQHRFGRQGAGDGHRPDDAAFTGDPAAQHRRTSRAATPTSPCCGR